MRFSNSVIALALASIAVGSTLPVKRATESVSSDEGTEVVTIPAPAAGLLDAGDSIDRGTAIADAVIGVVEAVLKILGGIGDDIQARKEFTKQTVSRVRSETGLNVVMSNVGYTFVGTPVSKLTTKYNAKIGADVTFDVLTFEAGTYDLDGDGGFQNWAFIVDAACVQDAKGKHIEC